MKRLSVIFLFLMGLAIFDWSCGPGPGFSDTKPSIIVGIDTITYVTGTNGYSSYQFDGDSIAYDSLFILVSFKDAMFVNHGFGTAAFATPPAMPPHTEWKPDSIHVYNGNERIDSLMTMQKESSSSEFISLDSFTNKYFGYSYIPLSYYFKLVQQPLQRDTFAFNFKFYFDTGEVFEKTSEPIIILP
jgi:hypothetical protein